MRRSSAMKFFAIAACMALAIGTVHAMVTAASLGQAVVILVLVLGAIATGPALLAWTEAAEHEQAIGAARKPHVPRQPER